MFILCFFFFKQKTAYEMRISDWSSDVCSSDLEQDQVTVLTVAASEDDRRDRRLFHFQLLVDECLLGTRDPEMGRHLRINAHNRRHCQPDRSEEHKSELQSLMRISYAVFCLTKKKQPNLTLTL